MKKKSVIFLAIVLLASSVFLFASLAPQRSKLQTNNEKAESISDTEVRRGEYAVKLVIQGENNFGFEIRKQDKVIYLQLSNPFSQTPEGFVYPNDATTVGWWVVEQLKIDGRFPGSIAYNEALEKQLNVKRFLNQP